MDREIWNRYGQLDCDNLPIFYLAIVETLARFTYKTRRSGGLYYTYISIYPYRVAIRHHTDATHNPPMRRQKNNSKKMKLKHKKHLRKGFSLVELLVVIAIIAGLAAMSYGPIMKQVKAAAKTNAINNSKQIFVALTSFASDNDGLFPNAGTAKTGETGGSAVACFTQLLNAGKIDEEATFWNAENIVLDTVDAVKPDEDGTLTAGENAYGYIEGLSSSSRTNLPITFDSSKDGAAFNTAVWDGSAIITKLNGSVKALPIAYGGGKPLNDDGSGKDGPINEKRGTSDIDIFAASSLPGSAIVHGPK